MRTQGAVNINNKYRLSVFDVINKQWIHKDDYPNYKSIAEDIDMTYDVVRDIALNRSKKLQKFFNITKIKNNNI